jgi:DNA-directed RNA polymerase specialized sigma24 family protein
VNITPFPDEALLSWLLRCSAPFDVSPAELLFGFRDMPFLNGRYWWLRPDPVTVRAASNATGVSVERIRTMTLGDDTPWAAFDDVRSPFARVRYVESLKTKKSRLAMTVCPRCLATDSVAYYRHLWSAGWVSVCTIHNVVLINACPGCGKDLVSSSLVSKRQLRPSHCGCCSLRMSQVGCREAHPLAVNLQKRLIAARFRGLFALPHHRSIQWPLALSLCSALLALAWTETSRANRPRLISIAAAEVGASVFSDNSSDNYDGFLLLSWMLNQWARVVPHLAESAERALAGCVRSGLPYSALHRQVTSEILEPTWTMNRPAQRVSSDKLADARRRPPRLLTAGTGGQPRTSYPEVRSRLMSYLRSAGLDIDSAEDLAHDTIVCTLKTGYRALDSRAYLQMTTRNVLLDDQRRRRRRRDCRTALQALFGESRDLRDGFRVLAAQQEIGVVLGCLNKMPDKRREAWLSARVNRVPIKQAAALSATPVKTIEKRLRLADKRVLAAFRSAGIEIPVSGKKAKWLLKHGTRAAKGAPSGNTQQGWVEVSEPRGSARFDN